MWCTLHADTATVGALLSVWMAQPTVAYEAVGGWVCLWGVDVLVGWWVCLWGWVCPGLPVNRSTDQ